MTLDIARRLPFPLFALDFEASGLGEYTYPIEIGVASWPTPDAPIWSWSALIQPTSEWRENFLWIAESQAVHGVTPQELANGVTPREALEHANRLIGPTRAFCDGGFHDARWLHHLSRAADMRPVFLLTDWDGLAGLLEPDEYHRMVTWFDQVHVPHRAAADAELLLKGLAIGLGLQRP